MRSVLSRRLLSAATAVAAAVGLAVVGAAPAWAAAPANDNFANAQAQTGSFTDSLNNADATTEGSEPLVPSCVDPTEGVGKTVWYGLTINAGDEVSASTFGSNFDTVLVIYTGASLGSLSEIACNDDGLGGGGASVLAFTATSSTTYWIQASGYNDNFAGQASGNLALDVDVTALGCTITGTNGNDTLNGTNGNDVICGLGGNDTIDGGNGSDTIYGGDGADAISGGNGGDTINAGAGNDTTGGETLLGSLLSFDNGNDTINGGPGNDNIDGQNGNDTIVDTSGTDTASGSLGGDSINVQDGAGGDTANGGLGSDTCTVDAGDTNNC